MIGQHWAPSNKADPRAVAIYERHYSCRQYADGRKRTQCAPPGETIVLLTPTCDALFIWVKNKVERYDHQVGVNCAAFRNEGAVLSSELIREADEWAIARWGAERHFTYVDDGKIRRKRDPGRCFRRAGWQPAGRNKDGRLTILEFLPEVAA